MIIPQHHDALTSMTIAKMFQTHSLAGLIATIDAPMWQMDIAPSYLNQRTNHDRSI
jgi:hypothetical protein